MKVGLIDVDRFTMEIDMARQHLEYWEESYRKAEKAWRELDESERN